MHLLVLGGTIFLGRYVVEQALARGWRVTLFHRGKHGAELFPEAEHVLGDRTTPEGLAALRGRRFDAVIDCCGYLPRDVRASREAIDGGAYLFVSSISAYADVSKPGLDEDAPLAPLPDPEPEQFVMELYGALKAACEREALARPGGIVVRPGLIVGPHDPSERFTYWPARIARGGEVLAPDRPERIVQFVDVRDLAAFCLDLVAMAPGERPHHTFHVSGPATSMGAVLETIREAVTQADGAGPETAADATFTWVPEAFLVEKGVAPWTELPVWVPADAAGMLAIDLSRALAAGLAFRPLAETARDTLAWDRARTRPDNTPNLTATKEREVLDAWRSR